MYTLLLFIIYIAFISLGLPDALLGAAWPIMHVQLNVPVHYAGVLSTIIAGGTIVSSLLSDRLTKMLRVGFVTAVSVCMTALGLFGFSVSNSFALLCVSAIPFGLGAGAVDAAINNYVALHYSSKHMNWLHCFWGVGAMIGPYLMGFYLTRGFAWNSAYRTVSILQVVFVAVLFASLPLWKNRVSAVNNDLPDTTAPAQGFLQILRIKGVKYILPAFFGYCALESATGLWASTYLVNHRGTGAETAALFSSLFYTGITFGRFLTGFISERLGDRKMIYMGIYIIFAGIIAVWIPIEADWVCLIGLVVIGLGCAPIYPSIIHSTPENFGAENSQAIVGVQMASAYTGTTVMPPLFGIIASFVGLGVYPVFLLLCTILMLSMITMLHKTVSS